MAKGPARIPIDVIRARLPAEVSLCEETYQGVKIKAKFIDCDYGEFWAVPFDVFCGHGHRKRGGLKISLARTRPLMSVKASLPVHTKIIDSTYVNMNTDARFIDEQYGEFTATPKAVIRWKTHPGRAFAKNRNKPYTVEYLKRILPKEITVVEETFCGAMKVCDFIHEDHGVFSATPNSIIRHNHKHPVARKEARKATNLKKYGCEHPSQNKEMFSKMRRSMRKTTVLSHWKTGEELLCVGSYESFVAQYLNENKINFQWQIQFKLNYGTYYCDLYLPDDDKYVEIKGWWMQKKSKDKWDEFHEKYPNSELWGADKLKSLGYIKTKKKK